MTSETHHRILGVEPAIFGLLLSFFSAALYTVTNICLRATVGYNDLWVTCLKTAPTALMGVGLIYWGLRRGARIEPSWKIIGVLVAASFVSQWGGNVSFQIGLRLVGLAVVVPITFGMLMISGAIFGRVWLNEPITPTAAVGIATMIVSIALLRFSAAEDAVVVTVSDAGLSRVAAGVAAAAVAGVSFAVVGAAMRWAVMRHVPSSVSITIVGLVGIITLGGASLWQVGAAGLLATPPRDFAIMLFGGLSNSIAFVMLGRALELTPVAQVNAVNSSQTAMAVIAGVQLFGEPASPYLYSGVLLMIVGLWLVNRRR